MIAFLVNQKHHIGIMNVWYVVLITIQKTLIKNIMYDLEDKVTLITGDEVTIKHQLGKETKDPNEIVWYEVEYQDGKLDHIAETEII